MLISQTLPRLERGAPDCGPGPISATCFIASNRLRQAFATGVMRKEFRSLGAAVGEMDRDILVTEPEFVGHPERVLSRRVLELLGGHTFR